MIHIYHLPYARSLRIIWLCEELKIDYQLIELDRASGDLNREGFRSKSPFSKVPCIEDEKTGVTLMESCAIVHYLIEQYGAGELIPKKGTGEWIDYIQWFSAAETLMTAVSPVIQHRYIRPEHKRVNALVIEGQEAIGNLLKALDKELTRKSYIAGDQFTAADVMLGYTLNLSYVCLADGETIPSVVESYIDRLMHRPAFQRAIPSYAQKARRLNPRDSVDSTSG